MSMPPKNAAELMRAFLAGEQPPQRPLTFRLKTWLLLKAFAVGEWAGKRLASKEFTPLEQLYLACRATGESPERLREQFTKLNDQAMDLMAKSAVLKAAKDGVVQ